MGHRSRLRLIEMETGMFDFGWSEIGLVVVIAVIILGPKELPRAMRTAGQWMRKLRLLAGDFQSHLDALVDEAELSEVRDQAKRLKSTNLTQELNRTIDPTGDVKKSINEVKETADASQADIKKAASDAPATAAPAEVLATDPAKPAADPVADPTTGSRV
jgi:sec-independent protein translocase protein TatB